MGVVFMCACGKTGMFIERLECFWKTVVHVCGGRDRGCGRRKNVVWGCVCVEKGLLCMEGVSG